MSAFPQKGKYLPSFEDPQQTSDEESTPHPIAASTLLMMDNMMVRVSAVKVEDCENLQEKGASLHLTPPKEILDAKAIQNSKGIALDISLPNVNPKDSGFEKVKKIVDQAASEASKLFKKMSPSKSSEVTFTVDNIHKCPEVQLKSVKSHDSELDSKSSITMLPKIAEHSENLSSVKDGNKAVQKTSDKIKENIQQDEKVEKDKETEFKKPHLLKKDLFETKSPLKGSPSGQSKLRSSNTPEKCGDSKLPAKRSEKSAELANEPPLKQINIKKNEKNVQKEMDKTDESKKNKSFKVSKVESTKCHNEATRSSSPTASKSTKSKQTYKQGVHPEAEKFMASKDKATQSKSPHPKQSEADISKSLVSEKSSATCQQEATRSSSPTASKSTKSKQTCKQKVHPEAEKSMASKDKATQSKSPYPKQSETDISKSLVSEKSSATCVPKPPERKKRSPFKSVGTTDPQATSNIKELEPIECSEKISPVSPKSLKDLSENKISKKLDTTKKSEESKPPQNKEIGSVSKESEIMTPTDLLTAESTALKPKDAKHCKDSEVPCTSVSDKSCESNIPKESESKIKGKESRSTLDSDTTCLFDLQISRSPISEFPKYNQISAPVAVTSHANRLESTNETGTSEHGDIVDARAKYIETDPIKEYPDKLQGASEIYELLVANNTTTVYVRSPVKNESIMEEKRSKDSSTDTEKFVQSSELTNVTQEPEALHKSSVGSQTSTENEKDGYYCCNCCALINSRKIYDESMKYKIEEMKDKLDELAKKQNDRGVTMRRLRSGIRNVALALYDMSDDIE